VIQGQRDIVTISVSVGAEGHGSLNRGQRDIVCSVRDRRTWHSLRQTQRNTEYSSRYWGKWYARTRDRGTWLSLPGTRYTVLHQEQRDMVYSTRDLGSMYRSKNHPPPPTKQKIIFGPSYDTPIFTPHAPLFAFNLPFLHLFYPCNFNLSCLIPFSPK
jgi:hypothetical protein